MELRSGRIIVDDEEPEVTLEVHDYSSQWIVEAIKDSHKAFKTGVYNLGDLRFALGWLANEASDMCAICKAHVGHAIRDLLKETPVPGVTLRKVQDLYTVEIEEEELKAAATKVVRK